MTGGAPAAVSLFPVPDAYLARIAAMSGYHFSGDAMFKGETRSRGAMLSYWVPDGLDARGAAIEIRGASGEVVRTLDGQANSGLNRTSWDLRVDLPGGEAEPSGEGGGGGFFRQPQGPEVVPGSYMVRVTVGEQSSEQSLTVRPDPRVDVPMADRIAKFEASMEAAVLNRRYTEADSRYDEIMEAVDRVLSTVRGMEGEDAEALRAAGEALKEAMEESVDFDPAASQRRGMFALQSSWDAPTTFERLALERMAAALDTIESDLNDMITGPVAEFRAQVRSAELDLFPEFETVGR
jgi:cytochrome c556